MCVFAQAGAKKSMACGRRRPCWFRGVSGSVRAGGRQAGVVGRSGGLNGAGAGLAQRLQLHAGIGAQAGLQLGQQAQQLLQLAVFQRDTRRW